ncbi:SDR family oxidoreductase [Marinihelvus fidelis]|uniref:SDR family oxidoreductase n=1 Tax=Marinihelvus fidelis TaxID=2613842 RepID=A0A5N0T610_9GAMM|nr:SDR family oxidoreductase [Marinihelvus fidelis]KAA9130251.1 SDR family oxidoreductase [Marinihelvus fidelis]
MSDSTNKSAADDETSTGWALVTGASAGIGTAFCRALAARGYDLVLVARREDRLKTLADELNAQCGTRCHVLAADLADPAAPATIVAQLMDAGIEVECLVNNAGYGVPGRLVEVDWKTHADFLQVMVTAVCELCRALMPGMIDRGRGQIINVASVAGHMPGSEGHTLYAASKAFLIKLSESLSLEGRRHGIRVSALCPGFTYSEFHDVTGTRDRVSTMPGFMWLQADEVAEYGLDAVLGRKHRTVAIPGRVYRFLVWLNGAWPWLGRQLNQRSTHRFRKFNED